MGYLYPLGQKLLTREQVNFKSAWKVPPEKPSQMMSWEQGSCANTVLHPQKNLKSFTSSEICPKVSMDPDCPRTDTRAGYLCRRSGVEEKKLNSSSELQERISRESE